MEKKLRRRERLTGFFIIFILLTFSAYSNSMNVGGRMGIPSNQQKENEQSSHRIQETRNITTNINDNKINNSVEQNSNQISEQVAQREENKDLASEQASSLKSIDKNLSNIENNFNLNRDNNSNFKTQREENNNSDNQKTVFKRKPKPQLIDQVKVHKVKSGETLWDIAHKHGLNIDSLIGANNISNMNSIKPGQKFKILPVKGIIYRVSPGESVASIARKFDLKTETIMKDNNIEDASSLKIDQKLILRGAKPEFSYQDRLDQKFMYPINTRITSYYGPRWGRVHEGIDFAAPMGSPIRAVSSGRVVYSGWATGYGYVVIIEHQRGLRTLYAHNSKLLVREGESVGKGEVISRSGNTGNSTGPHLHFEVQVNGRPENPLDYINR
ncbi:MAG: LysM peptidoglycan-binding domain-containing M23 family metallopeptidase [Halanaerobiales bacterium]|nr:LysM peptidoglycan-binding domain-containing M23 family metallopeptidase [Halanaerobiales bacterium]